MSYFILLAPLSSINDSSGNPVLLKFNTPKDAYWEPAKAPTGRIIGVSSPWRFKPLKLGWPVRSTVLKVFAASVV